VLPGEEMNFGQLWRFLEAYRAREGFSKADCKELQDCLAQESQDGELDALNVGHLFVRLGLPVSCTQVQRFVANVDIDGSGTIDFSEFIKIARQLSQHVSAHTTGLYSGGISGAAAREMLEAVVPISYHTDISSVVENFQKDHLDHYDCVSCVKQLRSLTRRQVQSNSGFGQSEMEALREQFTEYDKGKSGCLSDPQVHCLLENLFPDLATSASSRPKLLEIMQEATKHAGGAIDFAAFVRLMRNVKDLAELDRIRKERDTVQAVGFSAEEVNEFREVFLGSKDRDFLTLAEVQEMLKNIVPMGAKNTERLSKLFSEVVSERSGRKDADFSEFLLLMRGLMDSDFGCINEHAKRVVFEDLLDDCHSTSARSISKEQARRVAKELLGAFQRGTSILRNPDDKDSQVKLLRGRHRSATC
jgi:Ca2+-binding EF-hand superfamily protein